MPRLSNMQLRFASPVSASVALALCFSCSTAAHAQSLKEAIEGAILGDPTLRSASLNKDATSENVALARSRLLPQVTLQGTDQKITQTTSQDTLLGRSDKTFSGPSKNYQISIRQALIRPREVLGLSIAQSQKESGEIKYQTELADTRVKAANAWLEAVSSAKAQAIYEKSLEGFIKSASQEAARFSKGEGTKDGAMEAQAQLQNAKAMLADARLASEAKRRNFTLVTKIPLQGGLDAEFPQLKETFLNAISQEELWQRILQSSNDLQAAKAVEEIQKTRLRQSGMDHLPTLDLIASVNQAQNDATSTQGLRYQNKQIGVQFTVPIFSGGGINAAQRQALSVYEASQADRQALEQKIESEFLGVWATQQGLVEKIAAAQSAVDASSEQLKAAQKGFSLGLRTWAELANAQNTLARRQVDQIGAYLSLYKTQLRILRMLSADDPFWDQWISFVNVSALKEPAKVQ